LAGVDSGTGGGSAPSQRTSPTQTSSAFERIASLRSAFSRFSPGLSKLTTARPAVSVVTPPTWAPATGPPSAPLSARTQPSRTATVIASPTLARDGPVRLSRSGRFAVS
jgi:hypothetical protein